MKNNKLTLSVDKNLVDKVKHFIKQEDESITNIVSEFLETYVAMKSNKSISEDHFSSHAEKFAGIISLQNSSSKLNIADTIIAKHSKRFK